MKERYLLGFLMVCAAFLVGFPVGAQPTAPDQKVLEFRSKLRQLPRPQEANLEPPITRGSAAVAPGTVVMQIEFQLGSSEILPEHHRAVQALGLAISGDPFLKDNIFVVEGHTCSLGSDQSNKILAGKRAQAVVDYLVHTFQLPRDHFRVANYGKSQPVSSNATEEGRQKNRRVVIRNTFENVRLGAALKTFNERGVLINVNANMDFKPGQMFAVEVSPREKLYTYAYRLTLNGEEQQLFPNPSFTPLQNPLAAESLCRLPSFGRWFEIKGAPAEEILMVIGASTPVADPVNLCRRLASDFTGEVWGPATARGSQEDRRQPGRTGAQSRGIGGVVTIPKVPPEAPAVAPPAGPGPAPVATDSGEHQVAELPRDLTVWIRMIRHLK